MRKLLLTTVSAAVVAMPAFAGGVTDKEIVIGTSTDLSGVTVEWGVNNSNAIRMAFEEQNAKGGINGRMIKYIVEDSQYQVPRHVQAVNKLINRDNVFLMIANGGTPMNNATLPTQIEKQVPNMFPLTSARSMYTPLNKFKFGLASSYYDQIRAGLKYFVDNKGKKHICAASQDTDFGRDVMDGVRDQLKAMEGKASLVAETLHKPTDTDFSAAVAKLRDAKCDIVVLGTIVRDTLQFVGAARKVGWNVDMIGQAAIYDSAVAQVAGGVTEGVYTMTPVLFVAVDDPRREVKTFADDYKKKYGHVPNFAAQIGYTAAQVTIAALNNAGKDLNADSFIGGVEKIKDYKDIFGSPPMTFTKDKHQGSNESFLAQVKDGRWVAVSDAPLGY
ncbi:ABC transporter substrate-binding protein [Bradyrhizobium sp. LHD-71]|uniref:ABC transporter substrate-binding protein n=1 Tax=Bradyrhizobium sp. LHD-71 TaxID=3072141 RepID=UPI00280FEDDD|nr:ABC transporter substrate-binding protein [Bradyrhizobium sp. LHD-71]MDQ8732853.1 ABC transporter substrate-binding protein [Bradyrhizobium sp. LHD-71]